MLSNFKLKEIFAPTSSSPAREPNQINNVLVFPGMFKGALSVRASDITENMKVQAAYALAGLVSEDQLSAEYVIPSALDKTVADSVAAAVAQAARDEGIARI